MKRKENSPQVNLPTGRISFPGEAVQSCVCFNQGAYIQYEFLSGRYHRNLKDFLRHSWPSLFRDADASSLKSITDDDVIRAVEDVHDERVFQELHHKVNVLDNFLNRSLYSAVRENIAFMHTAISAQRRHSSIPPRVCVKLNTSMNGEDAVVDFIRDQYSSPQDPSLIRENTGFLHIRNTGKYFSCPNIPAAAQIGQYKNPRLLSLAVEAFDAKKRPSRTPDPRWIKCWASDGISSPHPLSCYKSTIIIPSTLLNNNLDDEFIESFSLESVDRAIFAYLCADHISANYFSDYDTNIGYVIADFLSIYFFKRFQMISHSASYDLSSRILARRAHQ